MAHFINRRQFLGYVAKAALALSWPVRDIFASTPDPYNLYRDGIIKRHILCSGRYLSELWLKEFDSASDSPSLLQYTRTFIAPHFPPEQSSKSRVYIPWLSPEGVVYGGGENPLLRGGIAMAAFAVEYMSKRDPSSLRYAERLLGYFEASEIQLPTGEKTGFFLRCDNISNASHRFEESDGLGFHASMDELSGLILGLYYYYLASPDGRQRDRIRSLARRLGRNLKKNGFLLIGPEAAPVIQKGFSASYLYQWSIQQALQRITGERFEPSTADYRAASDTLWQIYLNASERIRHTDKLELLGIMYLWTKNHDLDAAAAERWVSALRRDVGTAISENELFKSAFVDIFAGDIGGVLGQTASNVIKSASVHVESLRSPGNRYIATLNLQAQTIYFWSTENWYNNAMALHTVHYALDEEVNKANNSNEHAARVAAAAFRLTKNILCGERYSVPQVWPPGVKAGTPDNDFYAAVIVKGLLARFISIADFSCIVLAQVPIGSPYRDRVDEALNARVRMWKDLPVGEPGEVREGKWTAPVRWHNGKVFKPEQAKVGMDFCWERGPGDNAKKPRFLSTGTGVHPKASGMETDLFTRTIASGRDVMFEAGGLDYFFPRVLMSYWLDEPLEFTDPGVPPLRAVACLPLTRGGKYQRTKCTSDLVPTFIDLLLND